MDENFLNFVVPAWTEDAACRAVADLEIFFVNQGGSSKAARQVCSMCPVRPQCLQLAIDNNEDLGIWGGTSEVERRLLRHAIRDNDATGVVPPALLHKKQVVDPYEYVEEDAG